VKKILKKASTMTDGESAQGLVQKIMSLSKKCHDYFIKNFKADLKI
jgi:hypothetical protein